MHQFRYLPSRDTPWAFQNEMSLIENWAMEQMNVLTCIWWTARVNPLFAISSHKRQMCDEIDEMLPRLLRQKVLWLRQVLASPRSCTGVHLLHNYDRLVIILIWVSTYANVSMCRANDNISVFNNNYNIGCRGENFLRPPQREHMLINCFIIA